MAGSEERLLIFGEDGLDVHRLRLMALDNVSPGRKFDCIPATDFLIAEDEIEKGINFVMTGLGMRTAPGEFTGLVVAWWGFYKGSLSRERICVYADKFPEDTPKLAGVIKIPRANIGTTFLRSFLQGLRVHGN